MSGFKNISLGWSDFTFKEVLNNKIRNKWWKQGSGWVKVLWQHSLNSNYGQGRQSPSSTVKLANGKPWRLTWGCGSKKALPSHLAPKQCPTPWLLQHEREGQYRKFLIRPCWGIVQKILQWTCVFRWLCLFAFIVQSGLFGCGLRLGVFLQQFFGENVRHCLTSSSPISWTKQRWNGTWLAKACELPLERPVYCFHARFIRPL